MRWRGRLAPRQPLSVCALLPASGEEQASTASWEPRPPFEVAEMDWLAALRAWKALANQCPATSVAGSAAANQRPSRPSVREMLTSKRRWRHNGYKSNAWRHLGALEVWQQDWTLVFGTAGHSVVYQGTASPGLSDASIGKHLFVSFLLFAGPTWAVAARAPPLPLGLGIKVILIQPPAS